MVLSLFVESDTAGDGQSRAKSVAAGMVRRASWDTGRRPASIRFSCAIAPVSPGCQVDLMPAAQSIVGSSRNEESSTLGAPEALKSGTRAGSGGILSAMQLR